MIKKQVTTFKKPPSSNILYSLLACIHLSALPSYAGFPVTIILLIITLSLWQIHIIKNNNKNPGKLSQLIIIITVFISILYSYGQILGQQSGIALVILMTTLKLFETKNTRDCHIIIYSAFFIIATNFFLSQSIWLIIYAFFITILLTTILIAISDRLETIPFKIRLKMAGRHFVYAIPFMLVLFLLFPRIPGPLWALPQDAFSGHTGLSEEMSPGSINRLISSPSIAFRVKFDDAIPEHHLRYWRGAVLSLYDGKTWHRGDAPKTAKPNISFSKDETKLLRYNVTLEPTNLSWLLTLEYPFRHSNQYSISREAMLLTNKKVSNVTNYSVVSNSNAVNRALFKQEDYRNRLLPNNLNPETITLAKKLLSRSNYSKQQYINNVLSYYRDNNFIYTLSPDLLGDNAMDDFLFKSRRGFCEHYASSFVYLMRAAGIPSRVVIGYQGGKINPLDDYMIVRQSDAHAWAEVWIDNYWQRVDPTAAVSPDRVEQGILNAGLEKNKLPLLLVSNSDFIKNAAFLYDSFQNSWNQWVISFDQKKQNDLLKALGLEDATPSNLILLMVACLTITGLIISWFLFKQNTIEKDRVQHYYNIFCQKLQRYGIQRQLHEGPVDFESRLYDELTLTEKNRNDVTFVFKAYRTLHYGNLLNRKITEQYIKKIKTFKLD